MKVKIKALSVNRVWQGRRFRTREYDAYEREMFLLLPKLNVPEGKLQLTLVAGFSNKASDLDNVVKPFVDILQKKYSFDDKRIYRMILEKRDTKKGEDYLDFSLSPVE